MLVVMFRNSLAYESRKRVARRETALLPNKFVILVEYREQQMITPAMLQI